MNIHDVAIILHGTKENRAKTKLLFGLHMFPFVFEVDSFKEEPTNTDLLEKANSNNIELLPDVVLNIYCDNTKILDFVSWAFSEETKTHELFATLKKAYVDCVNNGHIWIEKDHRFLMRPRVKISNFQF